MKILKKEMGIAISEAINIKTNEGVFELEEGDIIFINEKVDILDIIKDIRDTDLSSTNEQQMKFVQLLKGIATSEEDLSNKYMKGLDKVITNYTTEFVADKEKK